MRTMAHRRRGDAVDASATPVRFPWLRTVWHAFVALCGLLLLGLMVPLVELVLVVPLMAAAMVVGALLALRMGARARGRAVRTALVVVFPAVLLVCFESLAAWLLPGDAQLSAAALAPVREWLAQTLWGGLSVPFWLGVAAMALRCAISLDAPDRSAVIWSGLQVFVVTFALGIGAAVLRSAA